MIISDKDTLSKRQRITFATEKTLAYVSVLELTSIWERSLRRAAIPLRYSQGYNPRPKMNFAAPLPVGCGTQTDYLDIWLDEALQPADIISALRNRTPIHLQVVDVTAVSLDEPTLADQLTSAEYDLWLFGITGEALADQIHQLMSSESVLLPRRGKKFRGKFYDLRPLILEMRSTPDRIDNGENVWMHLKARPGATGRPDEVLKAMGLIETARRCCRTRLNLS
jgi:radical SAM-linked protein